MDPTRTLTRDAFLTARPEATDSASTALGPGLPHPRPPGAPPAFHLLAKPTGAVCNLDCTYCFFLSKEALYPGSPVPDGGRPAGAVHQAAPRVAPDADRDDRLAGR